MIPLSKQQTARLLQKLCKERQCTPHDILGALPYHIDHQLILARMNDVYYIRSYSAPLPVCYTHPYKIWIDGVPMFSLPTRDAADSTAEQLLDVFPLAHSVRVSVGDVTLLEWRRVNVDHWYMKR